MHLEYRIVYAPCKYSWFAKWRVMATALCVLRSKRARGLLVGKCVLTEAGMRENVDFLSGNGDLNLTGMSL